MESSESEVEWEEVDNSKGEDGKCRGEGSLEIVVPTDGRGKGGKGKDKAQSLLEKALSAFERAHRLALHKAHLLCLLSRGLFLSGQCNDHTLQALLLSMVPEGMCELIPKCMKDSSKISLHKIVKWFSAESDFLQVAARRELLGLQRVSKAQLFVSLLRCFGLRMRLVMVLDPIPFKVPVRSRTKGEDRNPKRRKGRGGGGGNKRKGKGCVQVKMEKMKVELYGGDCSSEGGGESLGFGEQLLRYNLEKRESGERDTSAIGTDEATCKEMASGPDIVGKKVQKNNRKKMKTAASESLTEQKSPSKGEKKVKSPYFKEQQHNRVVDGTLSNKRKQRSKVDSKKMSSRKSKQSSPEWSQDDDDGDCDNGNDLKISRKRKRKLVKPSSVKKLKVAMIKDERDRRQELDDKVIAHAKIRTSEHIRVDHVKKYPEGEDDVKACPGEDVRHDVEVVEVEETGSWAEVYSPVRKKWLCVHLLSCSMEHPQLCEKHSLLPLHYVVAFENADVVSDVTARYASGWCTDTWKWRVSQEWWEESLRPFQPASLLEIMEENEDIYSKLSSQPLPLTIAEYKNHPLYVLKRHLLKFEAVYPEDSPVLGHCKGEPVYSRTNVHTLHTRDTWLKDGRLVRVGEKAYRTVKARPKKGQSSLEAQNSTIEVYGRWQTEEYMPPLVVDGKVPRNKHGNVEMFKPSMLPVGAAHIKIQGMQRVARKLDIDFAPAMVGWDFHGGFSHPVFDGIVVAAEFEEILLEAWETEEQITMEKEIKKREKKVLDRWRKFVKGALIRERVRRQFDSINS